MFILIFLIFSFNLRAIEFNYYHSQVSFNENDYSFNRYIRPQVKSILSEFFTIVKKLSQSSIPLSIKDLNKKSFYVVKSINSVCPHMPKACEQQLSSLIKTHKKISTKILSIQKVLYEGKTNENDLSKATFLKKILQYDNVNHEILDIVENLELGLNTAYYKNPTHLQHIVEKQYLQSSFLFSQSITDVKSEVEAVWFGYISFLEKYIEKDYDNAKFLKNIQTLNSSWNSFHMKMIKANYRPTKEVKSLIITMHRRWNSILKIILQRWR